MKWELPSSLPPLDLGINNSRFWYMDMDMQAVLMFVENMWKGQSIASRKAH